MSDVSEHEPFEKGYVRFSRTTSGLTTWAIVVPIGADEEAVRESRDMARRLHDELTATYPARERERRSRPTS